MKIAKPLPLDPDAQSRVDELKKLENQPEYPKVYPLHLPGGKFYIDSTPDKESITIRHKSGSFIVFQTNGDVFINSKRDLKVVAERNVAIKAGSSVQKNNDSDKSIIQVIGDAHLQVQNDLHVEVWGNKYETISKDYKIEVKGTYSIGSNDMNLVAKGKLNEKSHAKEVTNTFVTNNIGVPDKTGVGGEIRDVIYGNRVFELVDPRSTFQVISAGNISLVAGANIPVGDLSPGTICLTSANTQTQSVGTNLIQLALGNNIRNIGGDFVQNVGGIFVNTVGGIGLETFGGVYRLTAPLIFLN